MAYPVRVIPDPRVGEDWRSTEARAVVLSPVLHHVASLFHGRPTCSKASNIIRHSVSPSPSVILFHPRHPSLCFTLAICHSVSPFHPLLCFTLAIRHFVSLSPSVTLFHPSILYSVSPSPFVILFHLAVRHSVSPVHPLLCFTLAIRHSVSPFHPSLCFTLAIRHSATQLLRHGPVVGSYVMGLS